MATNNPPMIVIAIGPQKALCDRGIIARMAAKARQDDGPGPSHGRLDDGVDPGMAGRDVLLDLVHEDDAVAHDHTGERDQPEKRHEAERLAP